MTQSRKVSSRNLAEVVRLRITTCADLLSCSDLRRRRSPPCRRAARRGFTSSWLVWSTKSITHALTSFFVPAKVKEKVDDAREDQQENDHNEGGPNASTTLVLQTGHTGTSFHRARGMSACVVARVRVVRHIGQKNGLSGEAILFEPKGRYFGGVSTWQVRGNSLTWSLSTLGYTRAATTSRRSPPASGRVSLTA